MDSVYVDEHTVNSSIEKIISFPDFQLYEDYTGQLWFQLITWIKFQCDQCGEVYWVDDAKISSEGAKTKCVKCPKHYHGATTRKAAAACAKRTT